MRISRIGLVRRMLPLLVIASALLVAPAVLANMRLEGGGDVPFYARIERGESFHTDEWAAIIFYRPPECVPAEPEEFDLLDFFDVPRVFACGPPTTDGFTIWKNGPEIDPAPIQSNLHGLGAVPVWFVSWPELQAALADDRLTISELEAMPSLLIGSADYYQETLHPTEAARIPKISFVAHGILEDGRSFQVQASLSAGVAHVRIVFR